MGSRSDTHMRHDQISNKITQVRNEKAICNSDRFWAEIWKDLVDAVAQNLPDLDMAIDTTDEPQLLIPWEDMNS